MKISVSLAITLLSILLLSVFSAPSIQAQTITVTDTIKVTAAVAPLRIIVINKNLDIVQIISNTKDDVVPLVKMESSDGQDLPLSEKIFKQYNFLKPFFDFSKPGVIYTRENQSIRVFYKKIVALLQGA